MEQLLQLLGQFKMHLFSYSIYPLRQSRQMTSYSEVETNFAPGT